MNDAMQRQLISEMQQQQIFQRLWLMLKLLLYLLNEVMKLLLNQGLIKQWIRKFLIHHL